MNDISRKRGGIMREVEEGEVKIGGSLKRYQVYSRVSEMH